MVAIQISLDLAPQPCGWPHEGGCIHAATRTLDTGAGVVGACPKHQQSHWWADQLRGADQALAEARRSWTAGNGEREGE